MDSEKPNVFIFPARLLPRTASQHGHAGLSKHFAQPLTKPVRSANDNDIGLDDSTNSPPANNAPANQWRYNGIDNVIAQSALRLFALHGLASGDYAAGQAEKCFWANDSLGHKWWMAVSRQLDNQIVQKAQNQRTCRAKNAQKLIYFP